MFDSFLLRRSSLLRPHFVVSLYNMIFSILVSPSFTVILQTRTRCLIELAIGLPSNPFTGGANLGHVEALVSGACRVHCYMYMHYNISIYKYIVVTILSYANRCRKMETRKSINIRKHRRFLSCPLSPTHSHTALAEHFQFLCPPPTLTYELVVVGNRQAKNLLACFPRLSNKSKLGMLQIGFGVRSWQGVEQKYLTDRARATVRAVIMVCRRRPHRHVSAS